MIHPYKADRPLSFGFSRTRGGDPSFKFVVIINNMFFPHTRGWSQGKIADNVGTLVFPAHAGVILYITSFPAENIGFSRTRGGDPGRVFGIGSMGTVFPAHAGVILQI